MEDKIMEQEAIMENATEVTEVAGLDKKWLVIGGVAVALFVGGIIYNKVIKPKRAKAKARRLEAEQTAVIEGECSDVECEEYDVESDE